MTTKLKRDFAKEKEQDFLEILLNTFMNTLELSTKRPRSSISMNELSIETFQNNQLAYQNFLSTLHSLFGITRDYRENVEFEAFPTLGDAYEYIAIQTLINDGLIDVSDQ